MRGLLRSPTLATRHYMSERVTHLRRRMIEDMRVRNLSATTQASYVHAVKKFSRHFAFAG